MRVRLLKKIIFEKGMSIGILAKKTGIKKSLIWLRILGVGEFKAWEILRISNALSMSKNQIQEIFFGE